MQCKIKKLSIMNKIMRYLGIIVILLGAAVLMMYYFGMFNSNSALVTAGIMMVVGTIAHVILNKIFLED